MNKRLLILFLWLAKAASAQYYIRGEVIDEQNNLLPNAKILLHSTSYLYSSGGSGQFGILVNTLNDSLTVSLAGYQSITLPVDVNRYMTITLRLLRTNASVQKNKLVSFTKNLEIEGRKRWFASGESYSSLIENELVEASKYPETGFALRTDKASYSNVRRFLNMDSYVPPDAVRIEELLNYFGFPCSSPDPSSFSFETQLSECPWNSQHELLYLKVCAPKLDLRRIPPSNLVFLIDVSGSMDMPNRLPLLKSAFKLLVENLRAEDTISIVVYGGAVGVMLPPTGGDEKLKIRRAIEELTPGGSTPGESGIRQAYTLAKNKFIAGGNNRVILATDGDFNIGQTSEEQLEKLITAYKESGIYLTCLGVGMGNYKDSKLEVLAKKGNGNFAYLDSEAEAEKLLMKELTQTLFSVADDASLSICFDKNAVQQYKLIGYDNRLKALSDSLTEMEGGEVGSGHTILALFEIRRRSLNSSSLAALTLRYRSPADSVQMVTKYIVPAGKTAFAQLPSSYRFATSVAMFGMMLKEADKRGEKKFSWMELNTLASAAADRSDVVQEEFLRIIEKAKKIYAKRRRK